MSTTTTLIHWLLVAVAVCGVSVSVERLNHENPVFDSASSIFDYNYNPAFVSAGAHFDQSGMIVRCQSNSSDPEAPFAVTPCKLAWSPLTTKGGAIDVSHLHFGPVSEESVILEPESEAENYGIEDPRVVYRHADGTYYMFYSAVEQPAGKTDLTCRLCLATSPTPNIKKSWIKHGPIFSDSDVKWSKSGALLLRDDSESADHLLFWGDSTLVPGLQLATSSDLLHWRYNSTIWLPVRADSFDSYLVEAGPEPRQLSDGNWFMLYNSAQAGHPSPKPGYELQYNVGWLVLDQNDPTRILHRSSEPILSPETVWEVTGLTPNVVFVEGWTELAPNKFLIVFGEADDAIGAAVITVDVE